MSGGGGHGGGKRGKKHIEEEHENHERWLVSYADMVTLLFVLFVVLFAISSVDAAKFAALREGLADGFGAPLTAVDGGTGALDDIGTDTIAMDSFVSPLVSADPGATDDTKDKVTPAALKAAQAELVNRKIREEIIKKQRLEALEKKFDRELQKRGLTGTVTTRINERGLVVTILTNSIVFPPSSANLQSGGQQILGSLVPVLRSVPNTIAVEGHTDTTNSRPRGWTNENDLSAVRACSVQTYLESRGLPRSRMSCTGRADTAPIYDSNTNPRLNALNRRVELIILGDEPEKRSATDTLTEKQAAATLAASQQEEARADEPQVEESAEGAEAESGDSGH